MNPRTEPRTLREHIIGSNCHMLYDFLYTREVAEANTREVIGGGGSVENAVSGAEQATQTYAG